MEPALMIRSFGIVALVTACSNGVTDSTLDSVNSTSIYSGTAFIQPIPVGEMYTNNVGDVDTAICALGGEINAQAPTLSQMVFQGSMIRRYPVLWGEVLDKMRTNRNINSGLAGAGGLSCVSVALATGFATIGSGGIAWPILIPTVGCFVYGGAWATNRSPHAAVGQHNEALRTLSASPVEHFAQKTESMPRESYDIFLKAIRETHQHESLASCDSHQDNLKRMVLEANHCEYQIPNDSGSSVYVYVDEFVSTRQNIQVNPRRHVFQVEGKKTHPNGTIIFKGQLLRRGANGALSTDDAVGGWVRAQDFQPHTSLCED